MQCPALTLAKPSLICADGQAPGDAATGGPYDEPKCLQQWQDPGKDTKERQI